MELVKELARECAWRDFWDLRRAKRRLKKFISPEEDRALVECMVFIWREQ